VRRAFALLAMAVNGAIFIPNVEARRDAGNVNAMRMGNRLIIIIKFEHRHSEDIVTVVDEMSAVLLCHDVFSAVSCRRQRAAIVECCRLKPKVENLSKRIGLKELARNTQVKAVVWRFPNVIASFFTCKYRVTVNGSPAIRRIKGSVDA
jgi:hypothetical protein